MGWFDLSTFFSYLSLCRRSLSLHLGHLQFYEFTIEFDTTHAGSPISILGGFLDKSDQVESLRGKLDQVREQYNAVVFHAVENWQA